MRRSLRPVAACVVCVAWVIGFCALTSPVALAQAEDQKPAATLHVGDQAPPPSNGAWVKGEPVKRFEPGKIYVMEFWATWCGPCRAAIPHVTELQQKYEKDGVVIIGQNVWENDPSKVEPFVGEMGDQMNYRVVMDDASNGPPHKAQMAQTWMAAAGRNGIPCSFVIDRAGKIAWIGHPMKMEPVLKALVAGTFDAKTAAAEAEREQKLFGELGAAMQKGDPDAGLKVIDRFEKDMPEMAGELNQVRFQLLLQKKDYDAAYAAAGKAVDALQDDAQSLNQIAWTIVDREGLAKRDLDLAMRAAVRADELSHHKDAPILDTLARVHFEKGDVDRAVEIQTKAVELAKGEMKAELQQALKKYKDAQSNKLR